MGRKDILRDTVDLLILKTLTIGPMHGFGIARRIEQTSNAMLSVTEAALYPALQRMKRRGWIQSYWSSSENNRKAKYYKLTASGRKQLKTQSETWQRLSLGVNTVLVSKPKES